MALPLGNEPLDLTNLLKNLSKTEITLISELLRNKASKQLQDGVSGVSKVVGNLIDNKNGMSDCDTIYWYCNIKLLSSELQSAEQQALKRLKSTKKSFDCTVCRKKVELNYRQGLSVSLQKHICNTQKSQGTTGPAKNILQEYELYQSVRYTNKIKEKLFFKDPENKYYLYTINIVDDIILCLICDCEIPGKANVMQHVNGSRHIKGLQQDYDVVLAFHKYFEKLKEEYQVLQRDFCIYDHTSIQCMLCSRILLLQNVKQHIEGPCFAMKRDNQDVIPVKYDPHIMATIYKDLLEYCLTVDDVNCLLLQNFGNGIYCLVCNANVTKHIYIHLDSSIHQANLANTKTLESLKQYHQIWTALPLHVQVEQTYFRRREQKITCTVCSTFFPYDADVLANHVNSMNHKMFLMKMKNTDDVSMNSQKQSSQSVSSRSTSVETDRTTSLSTSSSSSNIGNRNGANSAAKPDIGTPPIPSSPSYTNVPASLGIAKIPYDKSVLEELYPDGLMLFTVTMGTVKYPIIIKRETSKHCFICNADVSTPVLLHANSPEHIAHMGSDRRRELLKKFHDLWISLPQSDQCRQIAFKIEDDLVCMLCDKRMAYDIKELKSHIESWGHLQKVMTNGILNDFKQVPNFSQTLSNGIVPNSAASTVSNTIVDNRVDVSNEKPKSLQDLLSSVKNSNKQEINKSPEKKAENCSTKSGTVTYSKKVLNDLYGDELIHYYIRIGDVKYPLIQNMGTYKRCLICNIDLISSVLFHMNSLSHIHSRSHPEKIKQLKKYHDLWLNFSESDQLEQKYFEIGEKLTCTLCQKELEYDEEALTAHIFSIGHRNETWCLNNESSTVSGRLIDMLNSTEVDDSSDDEVIEAEPVEEQTPVSSKSNETSAIREIDSNSVVQPVNAHDIIFYDTSTLQTVYNNLLRYVVLIKNKRYFFIQNRHESKYCLICQLTFSDIDQHINSSQHRRNAANGVYVKRVRTYHSLFMSLNAKFHKEQIYFEPKENGVRCIVCQSNSLTRLPLMEHLNSHKHIRMVELQGLKISNFKSVPEANFTSKERKAIHHTALQSLKSNLEQYTVAVNNTYYYYIQNRGNSQYCLICKMVINDLNLHVSTLQHVGNLSNPTVLASLRKYYLLFWSVALHLQLEQIHFVPDQHGVKCLKCDFVCYTTELLKNHLNSKMHEENQHERIPEINSVEAVHEVSEDVSESDVMKQETCPTVRDNLLEYIIIIQGLGYFYIQNRHDSLYCLICRLTIKNAAEHVKSAEHLNNEKDDSILKSVRRYHELFAVLNRKSKRQQIHFAPHSNGVNCIKCDVFCATAIEIVEHLESFAHSGIYEIKPNTAMLLEDDVAVQEESPSNLYFDETLDVIYPNLTQYSIDVDNMTYPCIQKRSRGLFCLICQTALHSPIETHVTNESHIKRCQNPLFRKMISDYHKAFSELSSKQQLQQTEFELYADKLVCIPCDKVRPPTASSIKEHLESAQHYQNVMKIGRILEKSQHTRLTKEEAKDFSRFLLQSLNANLRQHAVIIKRCSYYYLQNRRKYKYCLICQMTIEDVDIHVDSLEHNVKKVDDQSLKLVRTFYLLFDNLPLELRIEQVHFAPAGRGVRCLLCEEMYSSLLPLKRHLKSPTHRDTSNVRRSEYSVVEADVLENISCLSEVSSDEEAPEELPTPAVVEGGDINNDSTTKICDNKYVLEHFNKSYCLLCEMHFAPGHLTTKRHLKKLDKTTNVNSVLHKRVETFLRNWDQVAPAYQHMKNEFLPASPTLTFCLKCAVNVEFSILEKHLSQFHGEVLYDLPEKLSLNFKPPTTRYPPHIVVKYFKENIPQCNIIYDSVAYPIFQKTIAGLCCLLCRTVIHVDVFTHLSSQSHLNHLINTSGKRKRKLIKYHDYLAGLPSKYHEQMYYFNNSSTSSFFCLLCNVGFGKKKMTLHLESLEHISNLFQQLPAKASGSSNNKQNFIEEEPKEPTEKKRDLFKGNDIQELLFPQKINEFVRKLHCLDVDIIQAPTKDKFFCFLCQTETNDVVKHTSLPQHELKLLDHSSNVEPVRVYHEEWRKIDQQNRRFQGAFFPVTTSIVFCKICCFNVEYKKLDNHLKRCHNDSVYTEFQDRLDDDFNFISKKAYSPKVLRTLYKDNIPQCSLIVEGISYPIIQTVDNHLRCLLCQKEISDDKYSHLNSINHAMSAINLGMKKRLKTYHDTWLDEDEHFQMQQIYFEKDRDYYCKICDLDVKTGELTEHIKSTLHTTSLQKFLINERSLDKLNIFHDIEILPQIDRNKMNVESLQGSQLDGYYNSDSDSDESSDDGSKQYSKSIISEYYPDFDKHNCVVDNVRYPIFRTTVIGTVCMICKRNPKIELINEHLTKDKHKLKMIDETRRSKLRNFHKAWMKQEPAVQKHQKYFHRMQCLPCAIQVDYDSITDHVLNSKHERKIKLPFNATAKDRSDDEDFSGVAGNTSTPVKGKKTVTEGSASPKVTLNKSEKANQSIKSEKIRKPTHNIKKSVQNPNGQNIADKLPLRYGKDAKFLIVEGTNIFCGTCAKKLKNDVRSVKEHLDSTDHLKKSNISRKKIKYSCDICNKFYSTEASWDNHLVDLTHLARYNNLSKSRKGLTEYECLTCSLVIFGDEESTQKHHALFANRRAKEIVLPKPVLYLLSSRAFIQENSEKLLKEASKAFNSQDKEREVCVALVKVLKEYYPQCKAYPFGSRLTGLGYCDSDLDVFLDIGDMYNGNHHQDAEEQANIVTVVARTLQKHKNLFSDINKVAGARTPIVQVFHKDSNIDCDISFKHGLSVENTTFIKLCLDLQTILTPTLLYLKEWYASTNLSGLSSYALTMLMIFYLQTTGYLLSVKDLRRINPEKGQIIDGWETIKYTVSLRKMKEYVNNCDYTVIQLLENFFEYYAKFDFEKWVVCPLMGYLMLKSDFNGNGVNLPVEMANYIQKLRTSSNPEYFRNLSPMCVQDPFDLSHNLTKAFPRDMLKKFQAYCSLSKKHISALN